MRNKNLGLKAAALLAAVGLTLTACGGSNATGQSSDPKTAAGSGTPVEGGTFTFAEVTPINNWQTQAARFYEKANVLNSVLDRLTYFDVESGKVVGWIASDFTANKTQTEFTFTIRDGVTFSDGSDLNAKAVQKNLDALGLGIKSAQIQPNVDFAAYKSSEVVGNNKVKVTLKRPDANFLRATSSVTAGLVSPETLKLDNAGQTAIAKIVGSGPFVFESEKADEEVVFTSRDDYAWAPETAANQADAYLEKLVIKYLPEVAHRAGAAQSGQVDLVRGLQPVDEDVLSAGGGQVLAAQGVDLTTNHAAIRIGSGKLNDPKVRQALQVGIDRQALKDTVLSDSYVLAGSILNHQAPGFVDLSAELGYDPEKSKLLLEEAGWKVGTDGIREKDGKKLEITVASSNNSVVIKPAFELIEQQWRQIGVQLVNRAADNSFLTNAMVDDQIEFFGTRQFAYGGLGPVYAPATNNQTLNADKELNDLFTREQAATTEEEHLKLVEEEQRELVLDKALTLVLWDEVQVYGANKDAHIDFTSGTAPIFQGAWKSNG
ncbi:ABC transporter substrate-binding protein [Glutamicibacter ardleyensis]|uniref:ABC transporter substrate-binding protein n=1 Tax=Glutamicibacter ardleyensis TaxID=225894 RepID=UPI003FD36510